MDTIAEKKGLRSKINRLSVSINNREEQLKKVKLFSRLGIQERLALRHDKKEFSEALNQYKELAKGNQNVTDRYFDNQAEQRRAIQETYKGLSEKEAELFQKINRNQPFLPDFDWNDEAAIFARELDYQIGRSRIGSEENKELKSLFSKIESSIEDEINDPSNLHLKKLSRNQPTIQPNQSQEVPEIQRAPQRSMKMPSM
ncbi:hypothetical protein KI126_002055 [Enterococcus faecium]|uniref:hypothetical protein n=1 Tax=Enterococcus hirae TaxID=1354 RepID=UPI002E9F6809|nr:hypothetical protein [Enterococcus faecium]EME8274816.1 hypothetical protein [Enterococcus faecium]EMF0280026.1 hypothetical protein [Enterococcus faecium]